MYAVWVEVAEPEATEYILRDLTPYTHCVQVWVELAEPEATEYILRDLTPYTQYLFSIRVFNPQGVGPVSTVVVMTDEGGEG